MRLLTKLKIIPNYNALSGRVVNYKGGAMTGSRTLFAIAFFLSVISTGTVKLFAEANTAQLEKINADVAVLEKRMIDSDKTLPTLKVDYDFHDATEGVPPNFEFYFEMAKEGATEKSLLRVCKVHIGHEVYATDFIYYYDADEKPFKYLATSSGVPNTMAATRDAVFYGNNGKEIWNPNHLQPSISFAKISQIFHSLDMALSAYNR